jgi:hypothetical protein
LEPVPSTQDATSIADRKHQAEGDVLADGMRPRANGPEPRIGFELAATSFSPAEKIPG